MEMNEGQTKEWSAPHRGGRLQRVWPPRGDPQLSGWWPGADRRASGGGSRPAALSSDHGRCRQGAQDPTPIATLEALI